MSAVVLTLEEEALLREVYRRDVRFWNWSHWMTLYRKFDQAVIGFFWVLLPYGGKDQEMPVLRRRMNEIYYECLREYARDNYELGIRLNAETRKLILCPISDSD